METRMRATPTIALAAPAVLAVAFSLAACARQAPPVRACTQIGCDDGLAVVVGGVPPDAGAYRVEVRAAGETRVQECATPQECGRIFFPSLLPDEVTVDVIAGTARSSRTVRPEPRTVQPNGPGCPPTCRQAEVTVPWPDEGSAAGATGTASSPAPREAATGPGPAAAREIVRAYYADLAAGDVASAYRRWGDEGRASGRSFDDFRRGYEHTVAVSAEVGEPGRVEGAAGSRYVAVPVTVHARTAAGTEQCFRGSYTLRRSVVDGATAAQRAWSLHDGDLQPCRS